MNASDHGNRQAIFGEITRRVDVLSLFGRVEAVQLETATLVDDHLVDHERRDTIGAFTFGAAYDILRVSGFSASAGAAATFHAVPQVLEATHGRRPMSFQLFFSVRPPAPGGRMWNMRMSRPMPAMQPAAAAARLR
jgi:hypothetical protein